MLFRPVLSAIFVHTAVVVCWTWPSPMMERLDTLRFDQQGINKGSLGIFTTPCNLFSFAVGGGTSGNRSNAADWLRTAYHDMATYNAEDGTGGLDASIMFTEEQSRPENIGDGFDNTLQIVAGAAGRFVTLADAIALGAVYAVEQCGGPSIPYRGGRIDATEPGPSGVPEPQDSLDSHVAAFARQGFSATEMIQLVACGHTLGGVQHTSFPTIVPPSIDPANKQGNVAFDGSSSTFDNHIASEYIDGTTKNPLVVSSNLSMQSDLRIFSSDGNATIQAMAESPESFALICSALIGRMLDTVPKTVTLTDVLEPPAVKPDGISLMHNPNGSLNMTGRVRFWDLVENESRRVNLVWSSQEGTAKCDDCSIGLTHDPSKDFSTTLSGSHTSLFYNLPIQGANIGPSVGPSPTFWFEVVEDDQTTVYDQDGTGFPLQTTVLLASTTCVAFDIHNPISPIRLKVDIAVRKDLSPSLVFVQGEQPGGLPFLQGVTATYPAVFNEAASAKDPDYDIYSLNMTEANSFASDQILLNVAAEIGGENITDWTYFGASHPVWQLWMPSCAGS